MNKALSLVALLFPFIAFAQDEKDSSEVSFGGYADGYYSYYTNAKEVAYQQHDAIGAYHNNFGLNIAQLTAAYNSNRMRGVLTLHAGDIPAITWAGTYRNIQEANAGVRLAKGLWLDMGFFKTHVGTESFLPKDNLMSIITLGTFYGPFYQSGARLSYDTESEWHFELHAINGYNLHIDNNDYKTFGLLVSHDFGDHFGMGYAAMAGQERVGQLRDGYLIYQNMFANWNYEKLDVQVGLDVAVANQWRPTTPIGSNGWLANPLIAGLATFKYHFSDQFAASFRGEVFSDESNINSFSYSPSVNSTTGASRLSTDATGMTVFGSTFGFEYAPTTNGFLRIESRTLYHPDATTSIYPDGWDATRAPMNPMLNVRMQLMATAGFYFDKTIKFAR
jgi:hypothetical protein